MLKRLICVFFGHDWVERPMNHVRTKMECRRCGKTKYYNPKL